MVVLGSVDIIRGLATIRLCDRSQVPESILQVEMAVTNFARYPRLVVVELNEFNPAFLGKMAALIDLPNIRSMLRMSRASSTTDDLVEHQGLDPWVQWVGVHCGKPTVEHGIRRLAETRAQTSPQIWHAVAERGYSWGAWGVMNAPLGAIDGCNFFMPDAWSFDEIAYPPSLNDALALPRYVARNYLEIDRKKAFFAALRLARFFAPPAHWSLLARFALTASRAMLTTGPNVHTFGTLLDYLGVLCFIRLRASKRSDLSIIFLNHIAHLQHQFWTTDDRPHPEMELGLRLSDAMLGLLLADRQPEEAIIVVNGLRQENVAGKGHFVYRQINPQAAAEAIGVERGRIEQCMTNDAHILFEAAEDADRAEELLRNCRLSDGHDAFFVERQGPLRVFYQLAFEHAVTPETALICGNYTHPFYEVFQLVCERTGAHVPDGDVFFDGIDIPAKLSNHEIFHHILDYFPPQLSTRAA